MRQSPILQYWRQIQRDSLQFCSTGDNCNGTVSNSAVLVIITMGQSPIDIDPLYDELSWVRRCLSQQAAAGGRKLLALKGSGSEYLAFSVNRVALVVIL
jgi:hypothetical protein